MLITKKLLEDALKLESNRRVPPFDDKKQSINYDNADFEYQKWLRLHGYILIKELLEYVEKDETKNVNK